DDLAHALGGVEGGDVGGVPGVDDGHVVQRLGHHKAVLGDHAGIGDVPQPHVALGDVAVAVALAYLPYAAPRTDIAPTGVERHHHGAIGPLHDRIVDAGGRAFAEGVGIKIDRLQPRSRPSHRLGGVSPDVR